MSDYRIRPARQRPGRTISARRLNKVAEEGRDNRPLAGPGLDQWAFPGGSTLSAGVGEEWIFAMTGGSGIPARTGAPPGNLTPGSNPCALYRWTGTVLTRMPLLTYTVLNPWGGPVGGGRLIRVEQRWGVWWVANEDCVSGSSGSPVPQSISGFKSDAFSIGFASTLGTETGSVETGAFSGGFGLSSFGGSGLVPGSPILP